MTSVRQFLDYEGWSRRIFSRLTPVSPVSITPFPQRDSPLEEYWRSYYGSVYDVQGRNYDVLGSNSEPPLSANKHWELGRLMHAPSRMRTTVEVDPDNSRDTVELQLLRNIVRSES